MINRIAFINRLKTNQLYANPLLKGQQDGLMAMIDEWEARRLTDIRWLAYILATVYHETGRTFQPIEEWGKGYGRPYGKKLKYGGGPNKRVPYDKPDQLYYGRGHTQNTWFEIYEKLTKANKNGWDFLNEPDLLLTMKPSVWATFHGMLTGLYTGKKLSDYFNSTTEDWVNARRIINGTDRAELIALYAKRFLECLKP